MKKLDLLAITPESLTERELKVLELIHRGYSNKAIGDELGMSLTAVKERIRRICLKLAEKIDFDGYNSRVVMYRFYEENVLRYL